MSFQDFLFQKEEVSTIFQSSLHVLVTIRFTSLTIVIFLNDASNYVMKGEFMKKITVPWIVGKSHKTPSPTNKGDIKENREN